MDLCWTYSRKPMIFFSERSPCLAGLNTEVDSALNMWCHPELTRVEGADPLTHWWCFPNAASNTIDFRCHRGALLADCQFGFQQHHQVFFCQAFHLANTSGVACSGAVCNSPGYRTWYFPLLKNTRVLLTHFPNLLGYAERQHNHLVFQSAFIFCIICRFVF